MKTKAGRDFMRKVGAGLARGVDVGDTNYSVGVYGNKSGKKWLEIDRGKSQARMAREGKGSGPARRQRGKGAGCKK